MRFDPVVAIAGDERHPARHMMRVQRIEQAQQHVGIEAEPASCRSEEHTSELQSLMRISYAVFCLKKQIKLLSNMEQTSTTVYVLYKSHHNLRESQPSAITHHKTIQ